MSATGKFQEYREAQVAADEARSGGRTEEAVRLSAESARLFDEWCRDAGVGPYGTAVREE